jgi:hypothetical protein
LLKLKSENYKMSSKKQLRRSLISFKDIQIAYLLDDIVGVEKLISGRKNPGPLLRRALKELLKAGKKTESLEKYIIAHHGTGTRGRSIPISGQERVYKAQKLTAGTSFLRLPLAPLGTLKGGKVRVVFEDNRILVKNVD